MAFCDLSLLALTLLLSSAPPPIEIHATVSVDTKLTTLTSSVCPLGVRVSSTLGPIELIEDVGVPYLTSTKKHGRCTVLRFDLRRALDRSERMVAKRAGDSALLNVDLFLAAPNGDVEPVDLSVSFDLPSGVDVSVPWNRILGVDARGLVRHHVDDSTYRASGMMALGKLRRETITKNGTRLELAILDHPIALDERALERWLLSPLATVTGMRPGGLFPRIQVIVDPVPGGDDVEFGAAIRGGGPTLYLRVGSEARDVAGEWIATHELSHFLLPYVDRDHAWLSEGFATYYQNVLRARSGVLSEREVWQKLHEGFERGRANITGRALHEDAARMARERLFMRVYWSGTALLLLADVALRAEGHGSLAAAIHNFSIDELSNARRWSYEDVARRLDETVGHPVFLRLFVKWIGSNQFPELSDTYRKLGIRVGPNGVVQLDDNAPLAHVRRAITSPR